MTRTIFAALVWMAMANAHADCQDNCTGGEAICVESCSSTGFATLTCVTKCSKAATKCVKTCTPEPKPAPEPEKNAASKWSWKSAFPLDPGTGGLNTGGCCSGGVAPVTGRPKNITSPACAYVMCKPPEAEASTGRNWSGKLFDFAPGPRPVHIYDQCAKSPGPMCSLLSKRSEGDAPIDPSPNAQTQFRRQLEAFRQSTDYARTTGQITAVEQKQFMDAYKKDYKSAFGSK